jgi:hypothetical protein
MLVYTSIDWTVYKGICNCCADDDKAKLSNEPLAKKKRKCRQSNEPSGTCLRIKNLIRGHGTGKMENPLAPGDCGSQRVLVEHVGLEQPEILRGPFQPP